jgi:hypothetical protein
MKYLIEIINKEIVYDFSFQILEAIKVNNWLNNNTTIKYIKVSIDKIEYQKYKKYIPIGSIEFVLKFYKYFFNIDIKPINLLDFPKLIDRKLKIGTKNDIKRDDFIKEKDIFKGITDIYDKYIHLPDDERIYVISEPLEIVSEYRCFIYRKKLVGIKNYSGDFKIFPNINIIEKYINNFDKYNSYTMDFAILRNNEIKLIEIHQFFSCGLYGFYDYNILLNMYN